MRTAVHLRALALAGVLAACATPTRTAPPPAPETWLTSSAADRRLAVKLTKLRFDALAAADSLPGARLTAMDGVVSVGADQYTGPYALQLALMDLLQGMSADGFLLNPEVVKWCKDGLYEYGGSFRATARARAGSESRAVDGYYDARWIEEDGLPRVIRMRLAPGSGARALRSAQEIAECEDASGKRFLARHFRLRLSPRLPPLQAHTILSEWGSALDANGWATQKLTRRKSPYGVMNHSHSQVEVGVQWRPAGPFTVDLQSTILPEHARPAGFNSQLESHLGIDVRRMRTALLLGVERGLLQLAVGGQRVTGQMRAKQISFDGHMTSGIVDSTSTSLGGLGWIVQSGLTMPVTPSIGLELFGQWYTAPMSVPAHATVPAIRSDRPVMRGAIALQIAR